MSERSSVRLSSSRVGASIIGLLVAGLVLIGGLKTVPTVLASVFSTQAAPLELVVSPGTMTVTSSNSGGNAIALKGVGYSGNVSLTVSGLPSTIVTHAPSTSELQSGKGGYYCSSHCGSQDFPLTVSVTDGQWTSVGPTLLAGSGAAAGSSAVTITATANGQSVSKSFTLRIINDEYQIPEGGGAPTQAGTANPDAIVTVNNGTFSENRYKLTLSAGQSKTANVDIKNNSSSSQTVSLLSSISGSGVDGVNSELTGSLSASSVSLAASETKTVTLSLSAAAAATTGSYEVVLGVAQSDGSNRAGLNINVAVTGSSSSSSSSGSTNSSSGTTSSSATSGTTSSTSSGTTSSSTSSELSSTDSGSTQTTAAEQAKAAALASNAKKKTVAAKAAPTTITPAPGAPALTLEADPLAETQILTGVFHHVSVVGTAHDATGTPIPGATVTLDSDRHGPVTITNQFGQFVVGTTIQTTKTEELPQSMSLNVSHPSFATVTETLSLDRSAPATQLTKDVSLTLNDAAARLTAGAGIVGTPVAIKAEHFPVGGELHFFWNPYFTNRDTHPDGSQPITQRGLDGGKGRNSSGTLVDLPVLTVDADGKGEAQVPPPGVPGTYTLLATTDPDPTLPAGTPHPGAAGYYPSAGTAVTSVTIAGSATAGSSSITDSVAQHFFGASLDNLTATQRVAVQNFFAPVPASVMSTLPAGNPVVTNATVTATANKTATSAPEHLVGTPLPKQVYIRLKEGVRFTVSTTAADGTERTFSYTSADPLPVAATLNARLIDLAKRTLDVGGTIALSVNDAAPVAVTAADLGGDLITRFLPDSLETVVKVGDRVFGLTDFGREVGIQGATVLRATERAKETLADLEKVQGVSWLPYRTPITATQVDDSSAPSGFVTVTVLSEVTNAKELERSRNECRVRTIDDNHFGRRVIGQGSDCVVFYWNSFRVWTNQATIAASGSPVQAGDGGILYVLDGKSAEKLRHTTDVEKGFQDIVTNWYESRQKAEIARLEARFTAAKGELERARIRSRELGYGITQFGAVSAPISQTPAGVTIARAQETTAAEITPEQIRETNYVRVRYQGVPAMLAVTDPLGRAVGLNPIDGTHFVQIDGATDEGNGSDTSELFLPNLSEGEYLVTVTGSEAGNGKVTIETSAGTNAPQQSSYDLALTSGESQTLTAAVAFAAQRTVSPWSNLGWAAWLALLGLVVVCAIVIRRRHRPISDL